MLKNRVLGKMRMKSTEEEENKKKRINTENCKLYHGMKRESSSFYSLDEKETRTNSPVNIGYNRDRPNRKKT